MDLNGKKIILASGSPRRRELLHALGVEFELDTKNNFDESYDDSIAHRDIPSVLARGKSFGFHRDLQENEILITSDTLVLCDDVVMGKPKNREEAVAMLRRLSGKSHEVITAVCLRTTDSCVVKDDVARVHFKELSDSEISYYVDNFRPYDKAGAYGVQEWIGYIGIDRIEGSFYTIMGLPVHLLYDMIQQHV